MALLDREYIIQSHQQFKTTCQQIKEQIIALQARNERLSRRITTFLANSKITSARYFNRHPKPPPSGVIQPSTSSPVVWLVDDDPDDQFLLQHAFKQALPHVRTKAIEDGVDLITALEQDPLLPKLVLLDLNMPRKNGFEALRDLRALPACYDLPVVILTTSNNQEDRKQALQLGANDFLTKAALNADMIQVIKELAVKWHLTV